MRFSSATTSSLVIVAFLYLQLIAITKAANDPDFERQVGTVVRDQFARKYGSQLERFQLVTYSTQFVSMGDVEILAKVQISNSEYAHLRVLKSGFGNYDLLGYQTGKKLLDPIVPIAIGDPKPAVVELLPQFTLPPPTPPRPPPPPPPPPRPAPPRPSPTPSINRPIFVTFRHLPPLPPVTVPPTTTTTPKPTPPRDDDSSFRFAILNDIRPLFIEKALYRPVYFEPITYQVQKGPHVWTYFVKVKIEDNEYVHIAASRYAGEPPNWHVLTFERGKTISDEIEMRIHFGTFPTQPPTEPTTTTTMRIPPRFSTPRSRVLTPVDEQTDGELLQSLTKLRHEFYQQTDYFPRKFQLITYTVLMIPGSTYILKIRINDMEYAHLKVLKPITFPVQDMVLQNIQRNRTLLDAMVLWDDLDLITTKFAEAYPQGTGDLSRIRPMDTYTLNMVQEVFPDYLKLKLIPPPMYVPVYYRKQAMEGGYRYFFKVQTHFDKYSHIAIYQTLNKEVLLPEHTYFKAVRNELTLSDDLEAFNTSSAIQRLSETFEADMLLQNQVQGLMKEFKAANPNLYMETFLAVRRRICWTTEPKLVFVMVQIHPRQTVHLKLTMESREGDGIKLLAYALNKTFSDPIEFF